MALEEYNNKRSFKKTPEPEGKASTKEQRDKKPLHFVVQKHDASHVHYDFRLEMDGVLKSWAVPKGPSMDPSVKRLAMMVEDHPVSYMKFEGEIPQGNYGAGDVIVWDYGVYTSLETSDSNESEKALRHGLHKGEIKCALFGEKLKGGFVLVKLKTDDKSWLLIKEKDEYARPETEGQITEDVTSVVSGKPLPRDEMHAKETHTGKTHGKDPMPHNIKPMLATLTSEPFDKKDWIFEIKWDGYRAIAELHNGDVKMYSRNGISFTTRYAPITEALKKIKHSAILDGEIVALHKDGTSDFHALQEYDKKKVPLTYVVFDILYLDGKDLRNLPLIERKAQLKKILPKEKPLMYGDYIEEKGNDFFKQSTTLGLEGIVAKDSQSAYRDGIRSTSWLKIKNEKTQEALIVGFTEPRGSRTKFGSLVLAVHENDELKYIGHSGGGFDEEELKALYTKMKPLVTKKSPLKEKVPINSPITWIQPKLIAEIKFSEWTPDGRMRHPIFVGLREDKKVSEITREKEVHEEQPFTEEPALTHLDKIFWPDEEYTKGDVINYYEKIADVMLPYLIGRPMSLNRHPNGIDKPNFFQKNITFHVPDFVETEKIWSESNNAYINYLICNNKETLLYLANLGCIEMNPWNSRVENIDNPDFMIIDLDPGDVTWKDLINMAKIFHKILKIACEESVIKTSGKRGLHIVIPLGAQYSYEQIKNFAHLLVTIVHNEMPGITSLERDPKKRKKKIYLDYLQNRRGQTLAAPYSLRPTQGATVSTPLLWDEVTDALDPKAFTIKTIFKRLEKMGDLWKPILGKGVDLTESIKCLEKYLGKSPSLD